MRLLCLLWPLSVPAVPIDLNLAAAWQDNASNANRSADIIDALAFSASASATQRRSLSRDDSLSFGAQLSAETWPRFDGLDRAALGAIVGWRHKFGLGAQAPAFAIELSADGITARESARSGFGATLAFTYRQRLGEATLLTATHEFSRLDAHDAAFDRTGSETALALTRTLNDTWQFTATARLRYGTVLSYATPPRPELVALARARSNVTTFDRAMVAYSLADARTLTGALALTRTLDDHTALTLGLEYRDTDKAPLHYLNHAVTLALTHVF